MILWNFAAELLYAFAVVIGHKNSRFPVLFLGIQANRIASNSQWRGFSSGARDDAALFGTPGAQPPIPPVPIIAGCGLRIGYSGSGRGLAGGARGGGSGH